MDKQANIELKRENMRYELMRRIHDTFIIQFGMDSGVHMTPDKWSQTLYGDLAHKSDMQSIIDKVHNNYSIESFITHLYSKLESGGCRNFSAFQRVRSDFEFIAGINFEKKIPKPCKFDLNGEFNNLI